MAVSQNLRLKGPAARSNRVREYARLKSRARTDLKRAQEMLVVDVVTRLRSRYRTQSRAVQNPVQFVTWLLETHSLEHTFSPRFGYETRRFWAARLMREAGSLTLGSEQTLDWFAEAVQAQLGEIVHVYPAHQTVNGEPVDDLTLRFLPKAP